MTCGYGRTIGAPPQRSRSVKAALLAVPVIVVMLAGCTSTKSAEAPPAVATAAPTEEVERPIRDAQLTPGTRYRFADVLPGLVDVELTAPDPPLYHASDPTVTYLSPDAALLADALVIMAPWAMRVARDHYFSPADIATPEDEFEVTTRPPLDALLDYLSQLPFVEVTTAERPLTVGGVEGRAVDLRVLDLPPEASRRGSFIGVPSCAHTIVMPGVGAREGQIVFSKALAGELSTAPGATTLDGVELKGVRAPMTLYRLETPTSAVPASSPDAS